MRALIAVAVAIVCAASVAVAQKPPTSPKPGSKAAIAEAQKHYKQGEAYLELARQSHGDAKIYDDAIGEFEESYRLSLLPDVVYYIAQVYREKGDEDHALAKYEAFVDLKAQGELADKAREWIAQLRVSKQKREDEARAREEARRRAEADAEAHRQAELAAAAERARQEEIRRKQEEEQRKREEEERQRLAEQQRRQDEIRKRLEAEQAARVEWEGKRDARKQKRSKGYKLAGIGVGFGVVSIALAVAGTQQYAHVQSGGFTSASDISTAITTGQVLEGAAIGFAIPAAILLAVGVPRILGNWDPGEYKVAPMAGNGVAGVMLSGPLP